MTTQIVENLELFSEAQLESLEFLPEELENIEFELCPNLDSISPEQVAKDLEAYFAGKVEMTELKTLRRPRPMGNIAQRVLDLTNAARRKVGAPALSLHPRLTVAAQNHSNMMAQRRQLTHQFPGQPGVRDRIIRAGYPAGLAGENAARGQRTAEQVMSSWMKSPGHRKNLLNPQYRHLGVGYANGFWTQKFARPR
jgi:uncharacterized protein YkwD